jgi:integrase
MSVNRDPVDPSNVLWYWFNTVCKSLKENTKISYSDRISRFERFLAIKGGYDYDGDWTDIELDDVPSEEMLRPRDVNEDIAYEFLEHLQEDFAAETQQGTATTLSSAYDWCKDETIPVTDDPIGYNLDEHPNLLDETSPREPYIVDIEEARRVINDWDDPRYLAINLVLAKTLRRIGGVMNLDVRDINIDHPACDWTVHEDLRQWPDHMVFPKDKAKSESGRQDGNKTQTTRVCPIDDELKDALILYLTVRRGSLDPDEPFFRGVKSDRIGSGSVNGKFQEMAEKMGHYYGASDDDNMNPHYWRHWTTTTFEDRLGENNSLVTYFRGDKGGESKDGYNHWTKEKERLYREHVPKFFTGEVASDGEA